MVGDSSYSSRKISVLEHSGNNVFIDSGFRLHHSFLDYLRDHGNSVFDTVPESTVSCRIYFEICLLLQN